MLFVKQKLTQRSYVTAEALLTTKQIKLIDKKKFAKVALYKELKMFVMQIAALEMFLARLIIYFSQKTQVATLQQNKIFIYIMPKYTNIANVFSPNLAIKLSEYTSINEHTIQLESDKLLLYVLIYILALVELEILKTYIETHFKIGFI